jgi:DNA mismatch repair protein MutH
LNSNKLNKILWITIKSTLRQDISSRNIKDPKIRLRAIENLEEQLRNHFPDVHRNPIELLQHDRNEFKCRLGQYKPTGSLSGAEESIINNIYDYLENDLISPDPEKF